MLITFISSVTHLRGELRQSVEAKLSEVDTSTLSVSPPIHQTVADYVCNLAEEAFSEMTLFGDLGHSVESKIVEGLVYTTFDLKPLPGEGMECLYRRKKPEFEEAELCNLETAMYSALADVGVTGADE